MIILGIDPGYATVGYGIVRYEHGRFQTVDFGAITTPADMAFEKRLEIIYNEVGELIDRYQPDYLSIEKLFFNTNLTTGIEVAHARGVILLAATQRNVPYKEYTPLQVKGAVVGYGRAEKKQVMLMTQNLLGLSSIPKPDDAADALAMAICLAHSNYSLLEEQKK